MTMFFGELPPNPDGDRDEFTPDMLDTMESGFHQASRTMRPAMIAAPTIPTILTMSAALDAYERTETARIDELARQWLVDCGADHPLEVRDAREVLDTQLRAARAWLQAAGRKAGRQAEGVRL